MSYRTQAGVYRVDITPPAGISMSGYFARAGVSEGYGRPLTATAVVLAGGGRKVAILGCDVIAFTTFDVDEIRAAIAASIGTTVDSVLINTSHTHCGPTLTDYSWEPEDQKQIQRAYLANLKRLLTGCAVSADRRLQPARLGTANGSSHIGINRREFDPESGKVILGENPNGPMDPTVGVIRIDDLGGRPMAILFSYGCHTVTMGPKYLLLSPDFPGPARDVIERATGALAIFLQAAGGNINPIVGIGASDDDSDNMSRLGNSLGAEALQTAMRIRTDKLRGERVIFASLTRNSTYPLQPVEDRELTIDAAGEVARIPLVDPPSVEDARGILAERRRMLEAARKEGRPPQLLAFFHRFRDWAELLLERVEAGERKMTFPINLQAIRLGDVALAAAAGETLAELGLAVKAASPFANTHFLGYSNGCIGYIPPAECYPQEGWSPRETYSVPDMLCQAYMMPMHCAPEAAQTVVDGCTGLLRGLASRAG